MPTTFFTAEDICIIVCVMIASHVFVAAASFVTGAIHAQRKPEWLNRMPSWLARLLQ
jgi:hypothetical protein